MNKVCVYAILKNEEANIGRWLKCVKSADLVCVLDTGSDDSSLVKLSKSNYANLHVKQIVYEKFSFGQARNDSLNFARSIVKSMDNTDVTWVYVTLDLDEFIEEGGIDAIRNSWEWPSDLMCLNCSNTNQRVDHKIHSDSDNWIWYRSIHEMIRYKGKRRSELIKQSAVTSYKHEQTLTKNRNYFGMLLDSYSKDPFDITTIVYLVWEYYNRRDWDNYYNFIMTEIALLYTNTGDDYYLDGQYLASCYFNLITYYRTRPDYTSVDRCLGFIGRLINEGKIPKFRRYVYEKALNYFDKYSVDLNIELVEAGVKVLEECINTPIVEGYWVESSIRDDELYSLMGLKCWYELNDKLRGYNCFKRAYQINPSDANKSNMLICKEALNIVED